MNPSGSFSSDPFDSSPPGDDGAAHVAATERADSLSLDDDDKKITILSANGEKIEIESKFAFISNLLKQTFSSGSFDDSDPLRFNNISTSTWQNVVTYMRHHKGTDPAFRKDHPPSTRHPWSRHDRWNKVYIDRIGEDRQKLFELISAANFLHIDSLLHLGCAKVASLIKGQPLDRIEDILS